MSVMTDPTNTHHHHYKKHKKQNGVRRHKFSMVVTLVSLNNTFEKKELVLPFAPDVLHLGRQLNSNTQPAPDNGYFDSRVLSRTHAEIWADSDTGNVWIRDANSSNGTFVNGKRLDYNYQLKKNDVVDFGIDINSENNATYHPKISARVENISYLPLQHVPVPPLGSANNSTTNGSSSNSNSNNSSRSSISNGFSNGQTIAKRKDHIINLGPEQLEAALFGDPNSTLDQLAFVHAQKTGSSAFMNTAMTAGTTVDLVVQSLVTEINTARVETAKLASVKQLLVDIGTKQDTERAIRHKLPSVSILATQVKNLTQHLEAVQEQLELKEKEIKRLERTIVALNIDKAEAASRNNSINKINKTQNKDDEDFSNGSVSVVASRNNHKSKPNGSIKQHGCKKSQSGLELAAEESTVINDLAYNVSTPPPLNSITDHSPVVSTYHQEATILRDRAEQERENYKQRALLAETKLSVLFPLNLILGMSLGMVIYNKFIK